MEKQQPFSEAAIRQLAEFLANKQAAGCPVDYEVLIDGEQILPRSSDLQQFDLFYGFMQPESRIVEIRLYKGTSKRYDKYQYVVQQVESMELQIQQRIREEVEKREIVWTIQQLTRELKEAKSKCKDLKEDKRELKERIRQLESESGNSTMLNGLMGMMNRSETQPQEEKVLAGIRYKTLWEKMEQIHQQLGDDGFQFYLGTTLMLGEYPQLLPQVRQLIATINQQPST